MEKKKHWEEKLWTELQSKDRDQIQRNSLADYEEQNYFSLSSLNRTVRVFPESRLIESEDSALAENPDFQLFLISYLLYCQNIDPAGDWVSEKDLTGGSTFFRGPHAMPSAPLERRFGEDKELFREKAMKLGGEEASYGDIAFTFSLAPRIKATIVLWLGDDEFPPRVTFLMDRTIDAYLPLDVISAMISALTERLLSL